MSPERVDLAVRRIPDVAYIYAAFWYTHDMYTRTYILGKMRTGMSYMRASMPCLHALDVQDLSAPGGAFKIVDGVKYLLR
jgi:hypothetical protein